MDSRTGEIYNFESENQLKAKEVELKRKLIPLTDKQAKILTPLSKRKRKFLMRHGSCVCGSGKSFKKCCLKKYKGEKC